MEHIRGYISSLQQTMNQLPAQLIANVIGVLQRARLQGSQIFIIGNGGSAATASHFVCDLAKNTRSEGLPPFRVIGLTDNLAIVSAYANDEGYDQVFSQQLVSLIKAGDIVIGISTSGNSKNVINAIKEAQKHKATTIAFTGFDGGRLGPLVDINIHVKSNVIEHVEDIHLMLEHMIVKRIKDQGRSEMNIAPAIAKLAVDVFPD